LDKSKFGDLTRCLQCAVCTGSCPAARVIEGYNPREIILRYLLYGEETEIVESDMIWCCTTCHTCEERCPHGISVGALLLEIMNHAAQRGRLPDGVRQTIASIAETGRAVQVTSRAERVRDELGLEPIRNCNTEDIRALLHECGVDTMLEAT
jgi:heterodisulfide reductase subunit C